MEVMMAQEEFIIIIKLYFFTSTLDMRSSLLKIKKNN